MSEQKDKTMKRLLEAFLDTLSPSEVLFYETHLGIKVIVNKALRFGVDVGEKADA